MRFTIISSECDEFRNAEFYRISSLLKQCIIFDDRNQYKKTILKNYGYEYC